MANEQRHLDLFVLRYVPNVVSGERINIGIAAVERQSSKVSFAGVHFADLESLPRIHDDIDLDWLNAFSVEMKAAFSTPESVETFLQMILEQFSNTIQISEKKAPLLSDDPATEFERIATRYLSSSSNDL